MQLDPTETFRPFQYSLQRYFLKKIFLQQKYYGRTPLYPIFFVTLRVGTREFIGEGTTAQQAKHNAASKALKMMKTLPMPENANTCTQGGETWK